MLSIILATYNESETLPDALSAVFSSFKDSVEVVVVDDDSPDRTWRLASSLGDARVRVIRRIGERGLASAVARGIAESRGEIIAWFDCDMGYAAQYLPAMIERLSDCDVVIGSRYVPGGGDKRGRLRAGASRLINAFAGLLLGCGVRDYDSGFVAVRREVFDKVALSHEGFGEYFIEFVYDCRGKGLRVAEMPYVLREREKGVSKSAPSPGAFLKAGAGYALRILAVRFSSKRP